MEYKNIKHGKFISRPNRFIANVETGGKTEIVHVKNTGRCKELLIPGAAVFIEEKLSPYRKTKYDLISVYKGKKLINIDSQIPNKVFHEWLLDDNLFSGITLIRPEYTYSRSRFDFYIEAGGRRILAEVKGVTLEESGVALFPDAPTERGIKHINELCRCTADGYEAYIVFVMQMKGVLYFAPNIATHKAFGDALTVAAKQGVNIIAIDCAVTETSINAGDFVEVKLGI